MEAVFSSLNLLAVAAALVLALPATIVGLEVCLAFIGRGRQKTTPSGGRDNTNAQDTIAVLIPAHNEEAVLGQTLSVLVPTLPPSARLVVVADNCNDQTAQIARHWGAEVVERQDVANRGKGFALRAGLQHLADSPPRVVVFLDADCRVAAQTVGRLAAAALATGRPVQGLNLCPPDADASWQQRLSSFAFRFKNQVRTRGLFRCASVCHLMGTGMALPWDLACRVHLQGNHLAEDMQWGIDLAIAGWPAVFIEEAPVTSPLPSRPGAIRTQRTRWEHGHLRTLVTQVPRLLGHALRQRRWALAALALDLSVPPLAMLMLMLLAGELAALWFWALGGSSVPLGVLTAALAACGGSVLWAWAKLCRQEVPLSTMLLVPAYALSKLPIYVAFFFHRQQVWLRTPRERKSC
jgi:cellulose synthase/poly-beta-1,6-N-acetylglucosamine synthase-like glycosyltransferase